MEGIIAPTDSRWRNDLRYFEEDLMEEADNEKVLIEEEQRRKRKIFEVNKQEWKPLFFDEVPHRRRWVPRRVLRFSINSLLN